MRVVLLVKKKVNISNEIDVVSIERNFFLTAIQINT